MVQPRGIQRVVPNDADDDQVIAAAAEARADLIIFGDRQLRSLNGNYHGIAIVMPAAVQLIGR